jgi:predicted Zn-dependent protease
MNRKNVLRRSLAAGLFCALAACTGAPRADLKPGQAPPSDTLEAGIWMQADRAEAKLRSSGRVIPDPELQSYVHDLACRLAGEHCGGLRVYVLRQPYFNASMMPNGTMAVWSGLLLRCENEDQLATVIGHEIAHYVRRHQVQQWETMRNSLTAAQLFGVVTAAAGVPLGGFAVLGAYGNVMAYSRDLERDADTLGFEVMSSQGYDPQQAPRIWRNLIAEREAAEKEAPDPFFASHPPTEERMETLTEMAEAAPDAASPARDSKRFLNLVARHRADWLEDEIDLGHYAQMQVVLDRLKESGQSPGVIWYYQGEILRRNAEVEDKSEAVSAFRRALTFHDVPPVAHRSLGLVLQYQGDRAGARQAYQNYLAAAPDADDGAMIEFYIKKLESKS